jgi:hypothetical protein
LLLFEATMMIMFFLVAIERLLKILSWREEMRGRNVYSGVARNLQTYFWAPKIKQVHMYKYFILLKYMIGYNIYLIKK